MRDLDDLDYDPATGAVADVEADSEQEIRLTTLADLSLLLLTFFVALYALSDQSHARFEAYMASIREYLAVEPPGTASDVARTGAGGYEKPGNPLAERGSRMDLLIERESFLREQRKVYDNAKVFAERPVFAGRMVVDFEDGAVTLRLPSQALFDEPTSAARRPNAQGRALLAEIKDFLATHADQTANVRDHADPADFAAPANGTPATAADQDAAWEASAVRAASVLRVLVDLGLESRRLTATGLAAGEPLLPGVSPEQRVRNRRVEITLEKRSRR